jgi:hypothetical protein
MGAACSSAFILFLIFQFDLSIGRAKLYGIGLLVAYGLFLYRREGHIKCPKCNVPVTEKASLDVRPRCGADFGEPYVVNPIQ